MLDAAAAAKSLQSCPTLCDPIDGSLPGSPVPGILQARTLEQVAISFSNASLSMVPPRQEYCSGLPFPSPGDLLDPRIEPMSPGLTDEFFTTESIHGIFQARVLEWSAIAFSVPLHRVWQMLTVCVLTKQPVCTGGSQVGDLLPRQQQGLV